MRRKFVQIAAIILALSLLSTSFAAAEPNADSDMLQTDQMNISDAVPSPDDTGTALPTNPDESTVQEGTDPVDSESVGGESNPEQGTTEPGGEVIDPEQGTIEPGGEVIDPEQGTTEPGGEIVDPEQGTTEPGGEGSYPAPEPDPEPNPEPNPEPEIPAVVVPVIETEEETGDILRVGLNFGDKALTSGNLWNSIGNGFRFGFHDGNVFNQVGSTSEVKISVLKTQNLYYTSQMPDGYSGYAAENTFGPAVGCIHLQFPGTYATFAETKIVADALGGFPAWINGEFVVRYGLFLSEDEARTTQVMYNLLNTAVVATSEYGFTVVITGTNTPVFQFDDGGVHSKFVVKPGLDRSVKSVTHYKGIQYYGDFQFERINGGDITVVNLVDINDYVRGVIPYEMSPSWPLEALKAQAVSARSYAASINNASHSRNGFSVCTTECCQVYYGTGGATSHTDRAVDETAGVYAWYNNKPILAVFHSSDGGATENCENVWYEAVPYLRGVLDPYEALVTSKINSYNWTKAYTGVQLQEILNAKGYQCTEIVDVVFKNTDTGNVYSVTFVDSNGKNWTISKDSLRITFGFKSLRFSLADDGINYTLADNNTLDSVRGVWIVSGTGELVQVSTSPVYAITAEGVVEVPGSKLSGRTFVFNGTGRGHNLGMSQWGAYAMANAGFTYDQILKFYFTGIEIH